MALTLSPAGRGAPRWLTSAGAYVVGVFAGGMVALLVTLVVYESASSFLPLGAVATLAIIAIGVGVLRDVGASVPVPYRDVQVPEHLRHVLPIEATAVAYGAQLGFGFSTKFTFGLHLAMIAMLPFLSSIGEMMLVIGLFAVGKGLVLVTAIGTEDAGDRFAGRSSAVRYLRGVSVGGSFAAAVAILGSM